MKLMLDSQKKRKIDVAVDEEEKLMVTSCGSFNAFAGRNLGSAGENTLTHADMTFLHYCRSNTIFLAH
jgi:hypothetical protein